MHVRLIDESFFGRHFQAGTPMSPLYAFEPGNRNFTVGDRTLMDFSKTRVIRYFGEELVQPSIDLMVEELGYRSFFTARLATFILPDASRFQLIGKEAFCRCHDLVLVTISSSVEVIGESAFENCEMLQEVRIARGWRLRLIEKDAFKWCAYLQPIDVPSSTQMCEVVKILGRVYDEDGAERTRVQFITQMMRY
jgi:hypothetical protein